MISELEALPPTLFDMAFIGLVNVSSLPPFWVEMTSKLMSGTPPGGPDPPFPGLDAIKLSQTIYYYFKQVAIVFGGDGTPKTA